MIINFKHKGLKLFFESNDSSRLQPHHIEKIRRILYRLDEASSVEEVNIIGWGLHQLKGDRKNHWSIKVNGNYRITFRLDVDYVDYH
ncbi:type II toxin-antitoxin system RelE/ParE family toxin [Dyadobacter alkalitolerans]|uniref:type II toxin-antitoxin system RelE/ParE family toxin n=1 Tax=Dyadobacter alkalitolerans TaxID=492736 RepID=UPI0004792DAE|nr:type II toxin-antitoxin system RelE/ParE family toxin [Dyadobacter alkalitolerans]